MNYNQSARPDIAAKSEACKVLYFCSQSYVCLPSVAISASKLITQPDTQSKLGREMGGGGRGGGGGLFLIIRLGHHESTTWPSFARLVKRAILTSKF